MTTIREHLGELPEPYRSQALKNHEDFLARFPGEERGDLISLSRAISGAFSFSRSPEGYDYWNAVRAFLRSYVPLPPVLRVEVIGELDDHTVAAIGTYIQVGCTIFEGYQAEYIVRKFNELGEIRLGNLLVDIQQNDIVVNGGLVSKDKIREFLEGNGKRLGLKEPKTNEKAA